MLLVVLFLAFLEFLLLLLLLLLFLLILVLLLFLLLLELWSRTAVTFPLLVNGRERGCSCCSKSSNRKRTQ